MESLQKLYSIIQDSKELDLALSVDLLKQTVTPVADVTTDKNRIDLLTYKLYGLTYDEVLIIDPQTPITQIEYERY